MGRSVSYPNDSLPVFFSTESQDTEHGGEFIVDDLRDWFLAAFPSAWHQDGWAGRENHVLAENRHAEFGVSEYCGLWCAWIKPKSESGICQHWCEIAHSKLKRCWAEYTPVSAGSDGTVMYRKV